VNHIGTMTRLQHRVYRYDFAVPVPVP